MTNYFTARGEDLLHFLAPHLCVGCEEIHDDRVHTLCPTCRASLETSPYPEDLFGDLLANFNDEEIGLDAIGSLYSFERDGPMQRIIHAIKYRGCRHLAQSVGRELGETLALFPEFADIDLIVPIPLHTARRRDRGYNQSDAIALGIGMARGIDIDRHAVRRRRNTTTQTSLNARERRRNVEDAFVVSSDAIAGCNVLLCDDVFTTGATLNACAWALIGAGAATVVAATIARDLLNR